MSENERAAEVQRYADLMMAEIHKDMEKPFPWGKQIPRCVGSFSALHDYCDANEYTLDVMGDLALAFDDADKNDLVNAVLNECNNRLIAEANEIHARGECFEGPTFA